MDATNFFKGTRANFSPCPPPTNEPDYVSESGSRYWYASGYVVRASNHWGKVATCHWYLSGRSYGTRRGKGVTRPVRVGMCEWDSFSAS